MKGSSGWKRLFRLGHSRKRVEDEVEDELRFHMEDLVERYVKGGMAEEDAWAKVKAECGDLEAARNDLADSAWKTRRRSQRKEWVGSLIQDLRITLRQLRKRPAFAAMVILTLGLGIGANSAIFSVLRSVVLAPLPYPEPHELMTVWMPWEGYSFNPLSEPDWADLRDGSSSFQEWGVYERQALNLSGDGEAEQVSGTRATNGAVEALGVAPAHGRWFNAQETEGSIAKVAVVGHGLWQRRFGGDPALPNPPVDGELNAGPCLHSPAPPVGPL